MKILFEKEKDRKLFAEPRSLERHYRRYPERAKLIRKRLDELVDAENLATMRYMPQAHCHELKASRRGQLAVKLDGRYRMIFEVADEPVPRKPDGGLDWSGVTAIRILELAVDYHDE